MANSDQAPIGLAAQVRARRLPPPEVRLDIRRRARVSLRQMGGAVGVSAMTVRRWERGEAVPRLDHALAYRRLLDDLQKALS